MQDWRFDDLTRSLGKATSRRGVLKGLLGGVAAVVMGRAVGAPDAAAAGCSKEQCRQNAMRETILYQSTACNNICSDHRLLLGCIGCRINANRLYYKFLRDCETGDGCFSDFGQVCCGSACVNTSSDPKNCGSCGHACDPGATCENGQCSCADDQTQCGDRCVDTQTDHDNCGDCGHVCGDCQVCSGGQCVAKTCPEQSVCCKGTCVPLCISGDQPDPTTCQCNICKDQIDGAACDANDHSKLCCQEQCVSSTCPPGKTFDLDICRCQCAATCPPGQLQDPDTCECQDLCKYVTCGECQTCDQTSGDCVQADDQTACGNGQVCCSGTCQDNCGVCAGESDGTKCGALETCPGGPCSVLCNVCQNEQCVPVPDGTWCGEVSCSQCQGGACVLQPNGYACGNGGVCCYGRCQSTC